MPQLQAISLNDRETTPVAHAFVPRDISDGVGTVVRNTGIPVGEESLTVSSRKSGSKYRSRLVLKVPVVQTETINGVSTPRVVRTAFAAVDFTFEETSSEQERKNLVGMLQDALTASKTLVNDAVIKLEGVY